MNNLTAKKLFSSITPSIGLIGIGLIIWYFSNDSRMTLQTILFWIGAIPIAIFSVGRVRNYVGAANPSSWFERPVIEQSLKDRAQHGDSNSDYRIASGLNWFIAGLLVWAVSYFV